MKKLYAGLLVAAVVAAACSDNKKTSDVLAEDTTLTRDLALANRDTLSQPQLTDVPVTSAPAATEPTPRRTRSAPAEQVPPPPRIVRRTQSAPAPRPTTVVTQSGNTVTEGAVGSEKRYGTIGAGSEITMYSAQRVCTNTNNVGDRFTATLVNSVQGTDGAMIPSGATVVLEIVNAHPGRGNETAELEFAVRSIMINGQQYPVSSAVTYAQVERVRAETGSDDARKVAQGAAVGAILGQIFGHHTRSTVIGAATGAAAGAVTAAANSHYDGCIPAGGRIAIRLTEPLSVAL